MLERAVTPRHIEVLFEERLVAPKRALPEAKAACPPELATTPASEGGGLNLTADPLDLASGRRVT
jgi:hypothetical protein